MDETRFYLFWVDEFGSTFVLDKGSWQQSDVFWPDFGPNTYAFRPSYYSPARALKVMGPGVLYRTLDGMTETWNPLCGEWLLQGYGIGPEGYWLQLKDERRVPIYDDFAGGDEDEDFART